MSARVPEGNVIFVYSGREASHQVRSKSFDFSFTSSRRHEPNSEKNFPFMELIYIQSATTG